MQHNGTSEDMQQNSTSNKGVVQKADDWLKHVYHATKNELGDAALTTKVKTALLKDQATRKFTIHVKSDRGTVTLAGAVDSPAVAARAQSVASDVKSVQSVNNHLTWYTAAQDSAGDPAWKARGKVDDENSR
jgi:hyperosmotically inducible protein